MKEFLDFLGWLGTADAGVLRWLLLLLGGYIAYLQRQGVKLVQESNRLFERFAVQISEMKLEVARIDTWKDIHDEQDDKRHEDVRSEFHDVRDKIHGLALLPFVAQRNNGK